jgi:hypothetical protein
MTVRRLRIESDLRNMPYHQFTFAIYNIDSVHVSIRLCQGRFYLIKTKIDY